MKPYINVIKKEKLFPITIIFFTIVLMNNYCYKLLSKSINENNVNINESGSYNNISKEEVIAIKLQENDEEISFFAQTFQIDKEKLLEKLKENNDIIDFNNFTNDLVKYLFKLEKEEKSLFNKKITPCKEDKDYMIALIKYYTNIYPDVDFTIAASIAQIESNYKSAGMLKKNNIFGGMANGRLITYKNIEYGILRYIKLLNDGYFGKGLTTIEEIGKKYNPRIVDGKKIASPTWVKNVTGATNQFSEYSEVDINTLNLLKSNS